MLIDIIRILLKPLRPIRGMYYTLKVRIAVRKAGPVLRVWGPSKVNQNT